MGNALSALEGLAQRPRRLLAVGSARGSVEHISQHRSELDGRGERASRDGCAGVLWNFEASQVGGPQGGEGDQKKDLIDF